jgi:hypothetical protein
METLLLISNSTEIEDYSFIYIYISYLIIYSFKGLQAVGYFN